MIRILLSFEWTLNKIRQDRFWKIVEMPAIPTVGMRLWLRFSGDSWWYTVEGVAWDEHFPAIFEVELKSEDLDKDQSDYMIESGWQNEATNPACEFLRAEQRATK